MIFRKKTWFRYIFSFFITVLTFFSPSARNGKQISLTPLIFFQTWNSLQMLHITKTTIKKTTRSLLSSSRISFSQQQGPSWREKACSIDQCKGLHPTLDNKPHSLSFSPCGHMPSNVAGKLACYHENQRFLWMATNDPWYGSACP